MKKIVEWQASTSVRGVRSFLGFANFYRCYIDGFSKISNPLVNLTKKTSEWIWGEEENNSFEQLKFFFASSPILAQWEPERDTIVETDCSGFALGGCLSQTDEKGCLRPVAYFSRRLN